MDGAVAFGALRAGRGGCLCDSRSPQFGQTRIDNRRAHLADQRWNNRKGTFDRDRRTLRFPFRFSIHLLAQLVGAKAIALASLDGSVDLPWARLPGEGSSSCRFLLRPHNRCAMANGRTAYHMERPACDRPYYYDVDLCGVGDSLRAGDR